MKTNKLMRALILAAGLGLAVPLLAIAASGSNPNQSESAFDSVTITAKVVGIDKKDRYVELKGPDGNVFVVEVGDAIKNFKNIKVGDNVKLQYFEDVAIFIGRVGEQPEADAETVAASAPKGKKPAGVVAEVVDISAKIKAVDEANRKVTVEGPMGNTFTVKVDESAKSLGELKVGSDVHLRYIEAVAVSVEKP